MFQAAPVAEKAARPAKKAAPEPVAEDSGEDDSRAGRNRRRRRGGRGRRKVEQILLKHQMRIQQHH